MAARREPSLDAVLSCNVTVSPVMLVPAFPWRRLWVLSFPSRSKNHLIAINGEGISKCSGALVGGPGPHWHQSMGREPKRPHSLAGQTGTGFRCSHQRDRAGCPFLWPGRS